jgi:hypothetical protein
LTPSVVSAANRTDPKWYRASAAAVAGPYGRVIGALVTEAATDPAFRELYRERYVEPRRAQARTVLSRAMARGDIAIGTDIEAAIDVLYGPLYHRLLHGHAPLTAAFTDYAVHVVAAGLRALAQPDILGT